ncbi:hypothetical protein U0E18_31870, partial [Burkholderia pseudomallei]|uniref:hypothetical protein n=1 Tax=Burkholderia pseudomallei TaxID=28450 RepID=UPI002AB38D70
MSAVAIPELAITYAVYWEHLGVLKIGRAWRSHRLRNLTRTGGRVLIMWRDTPAGYERYALRELRQNFPQAFESADDSA